MSCTKSTKQPYFLQDLIEKAVHQILHYQTGLESCSVERGHWKVSVDELGGIITINIAGLINRKELEEFHNIIERE